MLRRRGLRIFALIAVIVLLSVVTLSFKEIHISVAGANIDTEGDGPLGLTLGLDLQGGSHLVYKANLPEEATVSFQEPVDESELQSVLAGLEQVGALFPKLYTIEGLDLDDDTRAALRLELERSLGSIDSFVVGVEAIDVTFSQDPGEANLKLILEQQGFAGAIINNPGQTRFTIRNLSLDDISRNELEDALTQNFGPLDSFFADLKEPTSDQMDGVVDTIQRRVNALGTSEPIIQKLGDDRVVVQLPGVGGSSIEVTFQSPPFVNDVAAVVQAVRENTGDTVEQTDLNSFTISIEGPLETGDLATLRTLLDSLGTVDSFVTGVTGDSENEILLSFRPLPSEQSIRTTLTDVIVGEFTVNSSNPITFDINTEEAVTTQEQEEIRGALEASVGTVLVFDATGGIERAKRLIGDTAQLVFKERECLVTIEELNANPLACEPIERGGAGQFIDKDIELTGEDLASAFAGRDATTNEPIVNVEFTSRGSGIFRVLTERLFELGDLGRIAIFLDDDLISAPTVQSPIRDGRGIIRGGFTRQSSSELAIQLESGRLPVPLELIRESTVDALLGKDSLRKSLIAGLIGLGLVLSFMVMYYRVAGLVAGVALLIYSVIVLAIFKLVPVTLTLSGIAGLVLAIGMAVDANVLIFERMKEELRSGRSLSSSIEVGFRRAWNAIRDGNVTTMLTCVILWWFGDRLGTPVVTGFAITLLIGVSVSMFTALTVSRNLLQILTFTPFGRKIALFTPEPRKRSVEVAGGGKQQWT